MSATTRPTAGRSVEAAPRIGWQPDDDDPRIGDAEAREEQTRAFAPELFSIHPMYAHEAEEEIMFLADAFLSHVARSVDQCTELSTVARQRRFHSCV